MKKITLKTAKKLLGVYAKNYTDDEILSLVNGLEHLAEVCIAAYGSKKHIGVIDSSNSAQDNSKQAYKL